MQRIFVKPTSPDLIVYDELSRIIPAEGKLVNKTIYILRRINDGSLAIRKQNATPETETPAEPLATKVVDKPKSTSKAASNKKASNGNIVDTEVKK